MATTENGIETRVLEGREEAVSRSGKSVQTHTQIFVEIPIFQAMEGEALSLPLDEADPRGHPCERELGFEVRAPRVRVAGPVECGGSAARSGDSFGQAAWLAGVVMIASNSIGVNRPRPAWRRRRW